MNKYKVYQTVSYDRYCFVEASNAIEAGIMSQEQDQSWNNDSAIEIFGTQVIKVPLKKYQVLRHKSYVAYVEAIDQDDAESKARELDLGDFQINYNYVCDSLDTVEELTE